MFNFIFCRRRQTKRRQNSQLIDFWPFKSLTKLRLPTVSLSKCGFGLRRRGGEITSRIIVSARFCSLTDIFIFLLLGAKKTAGRFIVTSHSQKLKIFPSFFGATPAYFYQLGPFSYFLPAARLMSSFGRSSCSSKRVDGY